IDAMERCRTGVRRIPAQLPSGVKVAHKTGSLNNTSSDIGIITGPDGNAVAVAIYVTGQGTRLNREGRIATIARAIYDGYGQSRQYASARYGSAGGTAVAADEAQQERAQPCGRALPCGADESSLVDSGFGRGLVLHGRFDCGRGLIGGFAGRIDCGTGFGSGIV